MADASTISSVGRPEIPLASAQWMTEREASRLFRFQDGRSAGQIWLGTEVAASKQPLAARDDERHVLLVSGTRGGKGTGIIIPTLCRWPGSCVVVDPKGENATVTARRRKAGSPYCRGMGQSVHVLDPFEEVLIDSFQKSRFNPLDGIDIESDFAMDDAARIADALVVPSSTTEPFWDQSARYLIKYVILYVLVETGYEQQRNLIAVWKLITQGAWMEQDRLREILPLQEHSKIPTKHALLWESMIACDAFGGAISAVGQRMKNLDPKTLESVLQFAALNLEFISGPAMQRCLASSDFSMSELKTRPEGMTLYLTLPQDYMESHFRWLRLLITAAIHEMKRVKGKPVTGNRTLFLLDEFAGLRRFDNVTNEVAQAAGFGIKFLFVLQNLAQLEEAYGKLSETFLSNTGLKIFFQIDDLHTSQYLVNLLGEQEIVRRQKTGSAGFQTSRQFSDTHGLQENWGTNRGTSRKSIWTPGGGTTTSDGTSFGGSNSFSSSWTQGTSESSNDGWQDAIHKRALLNSDEVRYLLSRIDDRSDGRYPGLLLAITPGQRPLIARRINYYDTKWFGGLFDPHPDHKPPPTLVELKNASQHSSNLNVGWYHSFDFVSQMPPAAAAAAIVVLSMLGLVALWPDTTKTAGQPNAGSFSDRSGPSLAGNAQSEGALEPLQAYRDGAADRQVWESWFANTTGDFRAGAEFWANQRSLPHPGICDARSAAADADAASWTKGCLAAQERLNQFDLRRKNEPNYRRGWNLTLNFAGMASQSAAFQAGASDREAWETWFASTSGDMRLRAEYWASHRSLRNATSCESRAIIQGNLWLSGCLEAQQRLTPYDLRRRRELDYRRGWNSGYSSLHPH